MNWLPNITPDSSSPVFSLYCSTRSVISLRFQPLMLISVCLIAASAFSTDLMLANGLSLVTTFADNSCTCSCSLSISAFRSLSCKRALVRAFPAFADTCCVSASSSSSFRSSMSNPPSSEGTSDSSSLSSSSSSSTSGVSTSSSSSSSSSVSGVSGSGSSFKPVALSIRSCKRSCRRCSGVLVS